MAERNQWGQQSPNLALFQLSESRLAWLVLFVGCSLSLPFLELARAVSHELRQDKAEADAGAQGRERVRPHEAGYFIERSFRCRRNRRGCLLDPLFGTVPGILHLARQTRSHFLGLVFNGADCASRGGPLKPV